MIDEKIIDGERKEKIINREAMNYSLARMEVTSPVIARHEAISGIKRTAGI